MGWFFLFFKKHVLVGHPIVHVSYCVSGTMMTMMMTPLLCFWNNDVVDVSSIVFLERPLLSTSRPPAKASNFSHTLEIGEKVLMKR